MTYKTFYEWKLEEYDEHEDIIDIHYDDKLPLSFVEKAYQDLHRWQICLVRDKVHDIDGIMDRDHAYVGFWEGYLLFQGNFEDGQAVPLKYVQELRKVNEAYLNNERSPA